MITTSDYWRDALAGMRPAIDMNAPQPGYYRRRFVRGGPWVPARVWFGRPFDPVTGEILDRSWRTRCEVNGAEVDALDQWTWIAAHPIAEADFRLLVDDKAWLREHAPNDPKVNPYRRVDTRTIAMPF